METAYTSLTSNGTETSTVVIQEETPSKPEPEETATEVSPSFIEIVPVCVP